MLAATVQASREERLRRQQARFRDRGGVFVKEEQSENPLLAILLSKLDQRPSTSGSAASTSSTGTATPVVLGSTPGASSDTLVASPRRSPKKRDKCALPQVLGISSSPEPKVTTKARVKKKVKRPASQVRQEAFKLNIKILSPEEVKAGAVAQSEWKVEIAKEKIDEAAADPPLSEGKGQARQMIGESPSVQAARPPTSTFDPVITLPSNPIAIPPHPRVEAKNPALELPTIGASEAATRVKKKNPATDYVDLSDGEPSPSTQRPACSAGKETTRQSKSSSAVALPGDAEVSGSKARPEKARAKPKPADIIDLSSEDDDVPLARKLSVPKSRARSMSPFTSKSTPSVTAAEGNDELAEEVVVPPPRSTRARSVAARRRVHFAGAVESCSIGGTRRSHGKTVFGYKKRPEPTSPVPEEDELDPNEGQDEGEEEDGEEESMSAVVRKSGKGQGEALHLDAESEEDEEPVVVVKKRGRKEVSTKGMQVAEQIDGKEDSASIAAITITKARRKGHATENEEEDVEPLRTKKKAGRKRKAAEVVERRTDDEDDVPPAKSKVTSRRKKPADTDTVTTLHDSDIDSKRTSTKPKSKRMKDFPVSANGGKENDVPLRVLTSKPRSKSHDPSKVFKRVFRPPASDSEVDPLDCI